MVCFGAAAIAIGGGVPWFFFAYLAGLGVGAVGMWLRRPALYTFFTPEESGLRTRVMVGMVFAYLCSLILGHSGVLPVFVGSGTIVVTWWVVRVLVPLDLLGTTLQILNAYTEQQAFLRSARDEAVQASRAKSRILNSVAHELRSPLAVALGVLAEVEERAWSPALATVREQVGKVLARITDLLDLVGLDGARRARGPLPCADPGEVAKRMTAGSDDVILEVAPECRGPVDSRPQPLSGY